MYPVVHIRNSNSPQGLRQYALDRRGADFARLDIRTANTTLIENGSDLFTQNPSPGRPQSNRRVPSVLARTSPPPGSRIASALILMSHVIPDQAGQVFRPVVAQQLAPDLDETSPVLLVGHPV